MQPRKEEVVSTTAGRTCDHRAAERFLIVLSNITGEIDRAYAATAEEAAIKAGALIGRLPYVNDGDTLTVHDRAEQIAISTPAGLLEDDLARAFGRA